MSLAAGRTTEIDRWTGWLLLVGGTSILADTVYTAIGGDFGSIPLSWLLTSIPFGIGFVLIPFVLLRSYQFLTDRTPTSALVGVTFVAALPVGTVVIVAWATLAHLSGLLPQVDALPVRIDTVFFTLLAIFAVGIATFAFGFLRSERTRFLGGSLLIFGAAWLAPLAVVTLTGVYPAWLGDVVVGSVATTMVAIGYSFPPAHFERDG